MGLLVCLCVYLVAGLSACKPCGFLSWNIILLPFYNYSGFNQPLLLHHEFVSYLTIPSCDYFLPSAQPYFDRFDHLRSINLKLGIRPAGIQ